MDKMAEDDYSYKKVVAFTVYEYAIEEYHRNLKKLSVHHVFNNKFKVDTQEEFKNIVDEPNLYDIINII